MPTVECHKENAITYQIEDSLSVRIPHTLYLYMFLFSAWIKKIKCPLSKAHAKTQFMLLFIYLLSLETSNGFFWYKNDALLFIRQIGFLIQFDGLQNTTNSSKE